MGKKIRFSLIGIVGNEILYKDKRSEWTLTLTLYIAMERNKVNVYSQNYISLYLVAKLDVLHIPCFEVLK